MKKILTYSMLIVLFAVLYDCKRSAGSNQPPETEAEVQAEQHAPANPEHTVIITKKKDFASVIRTSGQIMVDNKDVTTVTAKMPGIIKFSDNYIFPGVKTTTGQKLFTISGEQLAEGNTDLRLRQLRSDLENATANYERAKSLITDQIITQESYLEIKNNYEKLLAEYENISSSFDSSGSRVSSPAGGYIRDVYVKEGQMVVPGQPLVTIITEHAMILKADVSPEFLDLVPSIENANFSVGYSSKLFRTSEMGGKRISYGKSMEDDSYYVPVFFRFDYNRDLIDGTFADVYLTGRKRSGILTVPNTSLMEEFGRLYVYVEDEDGDFIKRYISTGGSDGEYTEVTGGLAENETIVATGAYNIKLSLMTDAAPAHTHNH